MAYKAIVAHARVRPHPNSDNGLKLLNINGYQTITGADVEDGELMVFFPEGGVLSEDYLRLNNEYREKLDMNADPKATAGFFEANGRVRTIRLRGERSEGYAVRPQMLAYTGVKPDEFFAGQEFNELNGHKVCWKYVSPATQRAMNHLQKQGKNARNYGLEMFHKHFDTDKLRHGIASIPDRARVIVTEKLHGSSGRTGLVLADNEPSTGFLAWCKSWFVSPEVTQSWQPVTGTRKVVRFIGEQDIRPDLAGEDFKTRKEIHDKLTPILRKGETWYYEIVGHWDTGANIFSHSIPEDNIGQKIWKRWKKITPEHWGRRFHYNYGTIGNQHEIYVYRITQTNEEGQSIDLSWEQIQARVLGAGYKVVPELDRGVISVTEGQRFYRSMDKLVDGKAEAALLYEVAEELANGASTLDSTHIREGVCLRVEHPQQMKTFKYKGFEFCHLENIVKNSDTYLDIEEAS